MKVAVTAMFQVGATYEIEIEDRLYSDREKDDILEDEYEKLLNMYPQEILALPNLNFFLFEASEACEIDNPRDPKFYYQG